MLTFYIAIITSVLLAPIAYIPYKYPFKNQEGKVTKEAKIFGVVLFLTVLAGFYTACSAYQSDIENTRFQKSSKESITNLQDSIKIVSINLYTAINKLDSLGYQYNSETGSFVRAKIQGNNNIVTDKLENSTIQQNRNGTNEANLNKGNNTGNIGGSGNTAAKNNVNGNNYGHVGDTKGEVEQRVVSPSKWMEHGFQTLIHLNGAALLRKATPGTGPGLYFTIPQT